MIDTAYKSNAINRDNTTRRTFFIDIDNDSMCDLNQQHTCCDIQHMNAKLHIIYILNIKNGQALYHQVKRLPSLRFYDDRDVIHSQVVWYKYRFCHAAYLHGKLLIEKRV